jgi:hypothetical protein
LKKFHSRRWLKLDPFWTLVAATKGHDRALFSFQFDNPPTYFWWKAASDMAI